MEELVLTEEEVKLILKRRELEKKRLERRKIASKHPAKQANNQPQQQAKNATDPVLGKNRPKGWDSHSNPCQVHAGRMTPNHPLYWFEEDVFKKIPNLEHGQQHIKIGKLLKMPVQTKSRDRQYHGLVHMETLWQQEMLPLNLKIRYEKFIEEQKIGDDFIHPGQKIEGEKYPIANIKRPWDKEKYLASVGDSYDENEKFVVGKKYRYPYDDEIGYKYEVAYSEEIEKVKKLI